MKLLYDPMHLFVAGEDYLSAVGTLSRYIINVLVHSVRQVGYSSRKAVACLPSDPRAQNWRSIFRQLQRCAYNGLITVIENGWPTDERERVARHNIDFLRAVWYGPGRP